MPMDATATTIEELSSASEDVFQSANEICVPFSPTATTVSGMDV